MTGAAGVTAVVLAGGQGTRLRPVTLDRYAKPMVPIPCGGRTYPFLEFVLGHLRRQGVSDFVICLGHLGAGIRDHFGDGARFAASIRYDDAGEADTGFRVMSALPLVRGSVFLVACGDVFLPLEVEAFLAAFEKRIDWHAQVAAIIGEGLWTPNLALAPDGAVTAHGPSVASAGGLETGTIAMRRAAFDGLQAVRNLSLTRDLFPRLIAGRSLGSAMVAAPFFDIGTPEGYHRFCRFAESGVAPPLSLMRG